MTIPPVLLTAEFAPLWARVSAALDRRGLDDRGRVPLPDDLAPSVHARLAELLEDRHTTRHTARPTARRTTRRSLDLAALDRALARRDTDLLDLLTAAGHAPSGRRERRTADEDRRAARDAALATTAATVLGDAPWVAGWVRAVRGRLPDADTARLAVRTVGKVLDRAAEDTPRSRGDVAALELGTAHALDTGRPARRWVRAALAHRVGTPDRDDAVLWDDAGLPGDLVSVPVLTWALPLRGDGVAAAVGAATVAGMPMPLTTLTLRSLVVALPEGTTVLSVENPRLLEAAVQQRLDLPVICSFGNPTRAYHLLLDGLLAAGAVVRHHGDVDADGLAITARLHARGVVPWRMEVADYVGAVRAAADDAVELPPVDPARVPATPWAPELAEAVRHHRVAVQEERVMDAVLAPPESR